MILLFSSAIDAASPKIPGGRVLYINSYNSGEKWSGEILGGFRDAFYRSAPDSILDMAELNCRNTKNFQPDPENLRHLTALLQNNRYDLILTVGNPAANLFLEKKLQPPPSVPVVFCGYSAGKEKKQLPQRTAGLLLPSCVPLNLELGLKLFPDTEAVAVLTGAEPEDVRLVREIARESDKYPGIRFQILSGKETDTAKMLSVLKALPENSFVVFHDWTTADPSANIPASSVLKQIREAYRGPVLCSQDNISGENILGGIMPKGEDHGREAAALAIRTLASGKDFSVLPPAVGTSRCVMHVPTMKKFRAAAGMLPGDALLLEKSDHAWRLYHPFLFAILLVLAMASLIYSISYRRSRRWEQRRQKIIYDALPVRIVAVDANGVIRFHQVPRKDPYFNFFPKHLNEFPEEIQDNFRKPIRKVLDTGEPLSFNFTFEKRRRHVEFQRLPKNIYGVSAVLWISTDIDDLERARGEMARLAERFQLTLRSIGEAVLVTDEQGKIILANAAAEKMTGYPMEELTRQQSLFGKLFPASSGNTPEEQRQALIGTDSEPDPRMDGRMEMVSKDGSRRLVEGSLTPIMNFSGERTGSVMIFRDMTGEYEKLNRLFMQKTLLEAAADFAGITYFQLDESKRRIRIMLNREKFWGTETDDFPESAQEWVHPDDLPLFQNEWRAFFRKVRDSLHLVYRGGADNQYRYFEMRCRKTVNPDNSQEEFFGVIRDIHEEKVSELALCNANLLIQSVMDHIPCFLHVKDFGNDDRYLFISKYALQQMGLSPEDVIGKTDYDFFPKDIADEYRQADREVMESRQTLNRQERVLSVGGVSHTIQTQKLCLERKSGNLLLGISFDITDLINQKNELQNYAQQEKMINTCLQSIMLTENDEEALRTALQHACEFFSASNCYVVTYNYETRQVVPFHEYVSPGNTPLLNPDTTIPLDLDNPWRREYKNHNFFLADRTDAPYLFDEGSIWKSFIDENGIKSSASSGIWLEKKLWGSFGIVFRQNYHAFSAQDKSALSALSNMIEIILERRKKRSDLTRSEFEKRLIMDTIRIPILLLDSELNLIRTNNAALDIIGKSERAIHEQPHLWRKCLHMDPPEECPAELACANSRIYSREVYFSGRTYLLSAYPILYEQKLIHILNTLIDITDSKATHQQLTRALMEAQEAAKAKSLFLATISHELRTPLNAVIGFSELLQKTPLSGEEQKDALESIHYAGNTLLNLINNVLDLSKIESEQMNIVMQPTNLQKLIEEVASIFRYKADEKKLSFHVECRPDIPTLILDTLRLRQILLNLVGNAIKFTHAGSVTVSAVFHVTDPGNRCGELTVTVSDTGIGISEESRKKLFMPFVQQYASRDADIYKGTGLGLAISQRLAKVMGGKIQLESELGKGSSFSLILPSQEYETNPQENPEPQRNSEQAELIHSPKKVLLVDDIPMNLKVLSAMLKKLGFEPRTAASGKEALEQISKELPDMVMTDLWMPGMGGVELLEHIRKEKHARHMLLAVITADTEADKHFALDGINGILLKPVTLEKLKNFFATLTDEPSSSE